MLRYLLKVPFDHFRSWETSTTYGKSQESLSVGTCSIFSTAQGDAFGTETTATLKRQVLPVSFLVVSVTAPAAATAAAAVTTRAVTASKCHHVSEEFPNSADLNSRMCRISRQVVYGR
jgi:hypothetical protein